MKSYSRRRAFAASSLLVLCVVSAVGELYLHDNLARPPLPIGHRIPPLPLLSMDGQVIMQDGGDRQKSLLIFFAPGCSHCRRELSNIDGLLRRFTGKLHILGVSLDNLESTEAFAAEMKLKFPIVVADREKLEKTLRLNILPAFFCVDEFGVLRNYYAGEHSLAVDERLISDFISSSNAP
ncbi:MAG: redoxin domain-containing protein [Bacteroidota bacterium]